jgi:hypothetical protein
MIRFAVWRRTAPERLCRIRPRSANFCGRTSCAVGSSARLENDFAAALVRALKSLRAATRTFSRMVRTHGLVDLGPRHRRIAA